MKFVLSVSLSQRSCFIGPGPLQSLALTLQKRMITFTAKHVMSLMTSSDELKAQMGSVYTEYVNRIDSDSEVDTRSHTSPHGHKL